MESSSFKSSLPKIVTIATETAFGQQGAAPGQVLRRTQSDLQLQVNELDSQEIVPTAQMRDARQGPRMVQGTLSGQLSASTYGMIFAALLRNSWATGAKSGTISDVAGSVDGNGNQVLASSCAFYSAKGFRKGDLVRPFSFNGSLNLNGVNCRVLSVADGTMVLQLPPGYAAQTFASASQTNSPAVSVPGSKLLIPPSGQAYTSFSVEHWYSDIALSELFLGCRPTQATINIPASGFVSFQAQFTGQNMIDAGAQVYAAPNGPTSNTSLTSAGGLIYYNGAPMAAITALNLQISTDAQAEPVAGSNYVPDVFLGTFRVRGSLTALMMNDGMTNDFLSENEVDLGVTVTASASKWTDVISFYLPRVKLMSATKTDSDRAISRSFNFVALEQINASASTGWDDTTISIIDSAD